MMLQALFKLLEELLGCLAVQIFFIEIETSQNSYVSKAQQKRLLLNPPTSLNVCCQQLFQDC